MKKREIGVAVIGSGRIGSLRAGMASRHPSVNFLALSDKNKTKADILAQKTGADFVTDNNLDAISDARVDAVVVATPEHDHVEAVLQAINLGKPIFLEKPLALTLEDGDLIANSAKKAGVEIVIGYSRRHDRRWMMTKQHIKEGRLGEIISIQSRVINTRAQMLEIIKRSPDASPVLDVLTYYVDMVCWYMEGIRPVEVVARSHGKIFRNLGHDTDEATWAIITFENGAIVNLGIFYALPATYPTFGQSPRFEIFGEDGVILLDADNKDSILYSDKGIPHAYVPDHDPKMLFMQTNSSGDWALDDFWGPIANETRSWLDHLVTGLPCPHTTIEEGRKTLQITLAIEESSRTGAAVKII
ncbi:MAG: Gfo/Idh/MocA family oxidoreductase [Rhodospirillales bacterium]|nr:Gfo/Idh/MocA family oxidoreductase [Rhodospirillales bacterium]MBT5429682.1 Gfo/Idh/MocA family oxidoreductase [Rhodospirillaceae bacterium]